METTVSATANITNGTDEGTAGPITNVFVLMLENHSLDNMFAMSRIPGLRVATTGNYNVYGDTRYSVQDGAPTVMPTDPGHEFTDVVEQLCGHGQSYRPGRYPPINNSGFAANYATSITEGSPPPLADVGEIMDCFTTASQLPVVYELATQFAICDQWFSSMPGPTWPNRFFVHAASSNGLDHSPTPEEILRWETVSGFTFPNGSIFDALNTAQIQWRIYNDTVSLFDPYSAYSNDPENGSPGGGIPQVGAIHNVSLVSDVYSLSSFASDLQGPYPYPYTFIEPNYGDVAGTYGGGSSQHPQDDVYGGENMLRAVYAAIRNSPLWSTSLLVVLYDEHGGFYDSCAPGVAPAPDDGSSGAYNEYGFDFKQYGVRVPAIVVSPLIPAGTVDHTVYDHASVLATVEKLLGLGSLTQRDAGANNLTSLLSLASPRTDCPTRLNPPAPPGPTATRTSAEIAASDQEPLPETGNLGGFLGITLKTELELSGHTPAARAAILANFKALRTRGDARAYIARVMKELAAARAARP
jgi:phospholipase C